MQINQILQRPMLSVLNPPEDVFSPVDKSSHCAELGNSIRFKRVFRRYLRYVITSLMMVAAVASIILILLGLLKDLRQCLTAGCILGIACFGAMLHGCLNHRSIPSTPDPLVFSAACMYPVTNLPFTAGADSAATAAAIATATLIPSSLGPPSSIMTPSMEAAMFTELQKRNSRAYLLEYHDEMPRKLEQKLPSKGILFPTVACDPIVEETSLGYSKLHRTDEIHHEESESDVYANDPVESIEGDMENRFGTSITHCKQKCINPSGTCDPKMRSRTTPPATDCQCVLYPSTIQTGNNRVSVSIPRSVPNAFFYSRYSSHGLPQKFLAFLSNSGPGECVQDYERRYDREREGLFGMKAWRHGWHSWYDS